MNQSSQVIWCEFCFSTRHVGYCPEQVSTPSFQPYYPPEEDRISKLEDTLVQFMQFTEDSIKRLEDLAVKLSEMIAEHGRNMVEAQGEVEESDEEEKTKKEKRKGSNPSPLADSFNSSRGK